MTSNRSGLSQGRKIIIIGGSAGGAGVAAKLRRHSEQDQILLIDRSQALSYASCGIPYYIGNVIQDGGRMQALNEQDYADLLNVQVRTRQEVLLINRQKKILAVKNLINGKSYYEAYDKLVIASGSKPRDAGFACEDKAPVFYLQGYESAEAVKAHLGKHTCRHALIIGAGFIGLETAENFQRLGMEVSIVEKSNQVLPNWDGEMSAVVHKHLNDRGIKLYLNQTVNRINQRNVILESGAILPYDIVVVASGVQPNSRLAASCELDIGENGGILVNQFMETSDPDIYALGDAVEVPDHLLGTFRLLPFAGPAQKQARVVAQNILGDRVEYQAPHSNGVVKVFSLTAAITGYSETQLKANRIAYEKSYTESLSNAGFYPGAQSMIIKLLYTPEQGRILGAQIIGSEGVDKRIDILATAMQTQMSVTQLAALDLNYAPPFSSAKDPVNIAGMVADNVLKHRVKQIHWNELDLNLLGGSLILDVRTEEEYQMRALPGAVNIPLQQLRQRLNELPRFEDIIIYCSYGKKGYFAYNILVQNGFTRVRNLSGGITVYSMAKLQNESDVPLPMEEQTNAVTESQERQQAMLEIDVSGLTCPGPIMQLAKAMKSATAGELVKITTTDFNFVSDVRTWCKRKGHQLLSIDDNDMSVQVVLQKARTV